MNLNKIHKFKSYFVAEIKVNKRLSKYIASHDYSHKLLIFLSVTIDSISIASFATAIGGPVGTACASFSLAFSISPGIVKKLLKITRN